MRRSARYVFSPLLFLPFIAAAQQDTIPEGMMQSGVDDLLRQADGPIAEGGLRTGITDFSSQDVREAAGIVYVLTAEEIAHAGCRDLEEALMLVPSFSPGRDVDDVVGFAIRGQWAHEGKCQYLLNGMPLNEASFGTYAVGMRFPLEHVSRIEVIDGPGSVMYGGFATVGVVNIVTKDLRDGESLSLSSSVGMVDAKVTQQRMHLFGAHRVGMETELGYSANLTTGSRFTRTEKTSDGRLMNFGDSAMAQTLNGYFSVRRKNFRGQFFASDYNLQVSDMPHDVLMRNFMASGEQRLRVGRKSRLDIGLMHRMQLPWFYSNGASMAYSLTNTVDHRTALNLTLSSRPAKWLSMTVGTQSYADQFQLYLQRPGNVFNVNDKDRLWTGDVAVFGELRAHTKFGSLVAGLRGEYHSLSGTGGAPRLGYTGVFGPFHMKLLYSAAYKVPTMQNVNLGPVDGGIKREFAWTREAEMGYRFTSRTSFTVCAFHTLIENPIVYVAEGDSNATGSYINRPASATEGIESTLRHNAKQWGANASFSAYRVDRAGTDLPETQLPDSLGNAFQGLAQFKGTLIAYLNIGSHLRLSGQAMWSSSSHVYQYVDPSKKDLQLVRYPSFTRAGFSVAYSFPWIEGLSATVGCLNMFDQRSWIQSPYNNGLSSLPMNGREFAFRVEYRLIL